MGGLNGVDKEIEAAAFSRGFKLGNSLLGFALKHFACLQIRFSVVYCHQGSSFCIPVIVLQDSLEIYILMEPTQESIHI